MYGPVNRWIPVLAAITLCCQSGLSRADESLQRAPIDELLAEADASGGLIVHLGCTDGTLAVDLAKRGQFLVQALTSNREQTQEIRNNLQSSEQYGAVSCAHLLGSKLPYVDNLVTLLVVDDPLSVSRDEMLRVLQPEGVACIRNDGKWERLVKPRRDTLDQWTHFLYDATNNAVSQDEEVGPPNRFQWITGPRWTRSHDHLASLSAMVSSGGRVFYIVDESPIAHVGIQPRWFLVARNAYNGVLLWKRPIGPWEGHLRGFRSGPTELARRLVAIGDRVFVTLGYGQPISQLDAVTGETLQDYDATKNALEFVCVQNRIFAVLGDRLPQNTDGGAKLQQPANIWHWWTIREDLAPRKRLMSLEAATGKVVWEKADASAATLYPTTLAVTEDKVVFQSPQGVFALESQTGEQLWHVERPISRQRLTWSTPTLVIHGDVVLSGDREANAAIPGTNETTADSPWVLSSQGGHAPKGQLIAYSLSSGKQLWASSCREGYNAAVDVLVAKGLVWSGSLVSRNDPGITTGLDLLTGEVQHNRTKDQDHFSIKMGHHRCYRNKATEDYLVLGRDGIEFIDTTTGQGVGNHWVRGTCQYGVMPSNGLIYSPPHSCACHIESKLNSFNVLAADTQPVARVDDSLRLERGPAYSTISVEGVNAGTDDQCQWPTYRRDVSRSGVATTEVASQIAAAWQTTLSDGHLSSPVVARGSVFLACIDQHTLHALDANSGQRLWSYTAGGRVDSPPTIHGNAVLFGCADGRLYCLNADTGELAWRFLAAHADRSIVVYDQLESAWPVHGSVLVKEDVLYAVAGRTPELAGGLTLYRLNPLTGELLSVSPIAAPALPDVLSADDTSLYLRHRRFDFDGVDQKTLVPHLYSPAGFLDDAWWHRTYWMVGTNMRSGWGGWPISGNQVPAGRIMVVDKNTVYGFGRLNQFHRDGAHVGLGKTQYKLFASDLTPQAKSAQAARRTASPADNGRVPAIWQRTLPLMARALLKSADRLYVAGPPDELAYPETTQVHPYYVTSDQALENQRASLAGHKGGVLKVVSSVDGKQLDTCVLDAPPTWDGMAAANNRLFISLTNGQVVCFSKAANP